MTGWARAAYGAAIGSILTLVVHPASRPLILSAWYQPASMVGLEDRSFLHEDQSRLPPPGSLEDASFWVQSGAVRVSTGHRLTETELQSLVKVVQAAASVDADNAYWKQMNAVYLHDLDRKVEARAMWIAASHCANWNDYQSNRLDALQHRFALKTGIHLCWQSAVPFFQRSIDPAQEIASFARALLSGVHTETKSDLELRLATLRNGWLLTDGSRSIAVGQVGIGVFDVGCGVDSKSANRKFHYEARYALKTKLHDILGAQAGDTEELLLKNGEGWSALTSTDEAVANPTETLALSGLTGALPGMFFALGVVGSLLYVLGWTTRFWPASGRIRNTVLVLSGVALGFAAYQAVGLPLIGFLVAMSVSFQALTPDKGDRRQLLRLGSLFELAVTVFVIALIAVLGMFLFGTTAPGAYSLLSMGVPSEYLFGSNILLGVVIIIICLVLVVPPAWAFTHRVSTVQVIRLMFQRLGGSLAVICLTTSVVLTPIMLNVDRALSDKMDKLLVNEPLYYLHP